MKMSYSSEQREAITERFLIRKYHWARLALLKDRSEGYPLLSGFRYSRAKAILNEAKRCSDKEYDLLIMASLKDKYETVLSKMEELVSVTERRKVDELEEETKKLYHELYLESIKPERLAKDRKLKKADMVKPLKEPVLEKCRGFFGEKGRRFDPGEFFFERLMGDWLVRTDLSFNNYDVDFLSFRISHKNNSQIETIFRYEYALSVSSEWPGNLYPEDVPELIERTLYLIKRFYEVDSPEILNELEF
jgi:hypothetical protein